MSQKLKLNPVEVDKLYWQKELSLLDIAKLLHCDMGTVRNTLIHHGHGTRSRSEGTRLALSKRPKRIAPKGSKHWNWKGGRHKMHSGYIEVYKPEHPRATVRGYVLEHILVWEQTHHQPLPDGWVIHHLNGIKDDNRPKNLFGMPRGKHSSALHLGALKQRIRELEEKIAKVR